MLILASLSHCDLGAEMMVFGAVIVCSRGERKESERKNEREILYDCYCVWLLRN